MQCCVQQLPSPPPPLKPPPPAVSLPTISQCPRPYLSFRETRCHSASRFCAGAHPLFLYLRDHSSAALCYIEAVRRRLPEITSAPMSPAKESMLGESSQDSKLALPELLVHHHSSVHAEPFLQGANLQCSKSKRGRRRGRGRYQYVLSLITI